MGDQKLFGATVILWALFAFTVFLDPASAVPQQRFDNGLSRRVDIGPGISPVDNSPGLGVELEAGWIVIKGKVDPTPEQREKIKGAEMTPIGYDGGPKTDWTLTAELGKPIFPEAIVDGLKNKVGGHKTATIGGEILKFFQGWAPCATKDCQVTIKGFDNLGPWAVQWPKNERDPATLGFGSQVTVAMPLEAVLQILSDAKSKTKNPLASPGALYGPKLQILTKDNFKSFSKIKASDITDEFLGFFSVLASYCTLASFSDPKQGPKHLIPIMPRTDFVTQYNKFIAPKLKDQLSDKTTNLFDIIKGATGSSNLETQTFKWATGTITPIKDNWTGKADDIKAGTLQVWKFLNYLQGYDKLGKKALPQMDLLTLMDKTMRHGQIGGLGNHMEDVVGTKKLVPIFEFRELAPVLGSALATTLGSYEDTVIAFHKQFSKRSIEAGEEADMLQEE